MAGPIQLPFELNPDQERSILTYSTSAQQLLSNQFTIRYAMESIDRAYMREENLTTEQIRARAANRVGDANKMQDPTVPIVMPQVEAAVGYYMDAFLSGQPIFSAAADPAWADQALQIDAIIAENAKTAKWKREFIKFFRDGLKYNLHAIELEWVEKNTAAVDNAIDPKTLSVKTKETIWRGNVLRRVDLYNAFFDPRVEPADISEHGEYAGYIDVLSRVRMKKMINELHGKVPVKVAIRAFESTLGSSQTIATNSAPFMFYQPIINPEPLQNQNSLQTFDWLQWATAADVRKPNANGIRYGNVYQVTKLYARIIPADFGFKVPSPNTPQVWKFIIVNNSVVLYCERQTNAHNLIPIFFGQPMDDGLRYQTKSFAGNVRDYQNVASALLAGHIASKRRLVGDRVLYDPTRIRQIDIESTEPAAKIPVRPGAFGKNIQEAVFPFPYRDENVNSMLNDAVIMTGMADKVNTQNQTQQGQFVKGNKTRSEFDTTMMNSNSRNKQMCLVTEEQVMQPLKDAILMNILQFQGEAVITNPITQQDIKINPVDLRKAAVQFRMADGMTPSDKLLNTDEMQTAIQVMGNSPQLGAGIEVAPAFNYLLKTRGVDLSPFVKTPLQMQYEQAVQQWQQVALEAIKAGQQPPQQPPMPPELIQELQEKQRTGGASISKVSVARESTVSLASPDAPNSAATQVQAANPASAGKS